MTCCRCIHRKIQPYITQQLAGLLVEVPGCNVQHLTITRDGGVANASLGTRGESADTRPSIQQQGWQSSIVQCFQLVDLQCVRRAYHFKDCAEWWLVVLHIGPTERISWQGLHHK